jgi:Na+/H+ antiporter NhaD/arsenite permease-like protein
MYILMIVIFVLGYIGIAFEHSLKIDKAAFALFTAVALWTVLVFGVDKLLPLQENALEFVDESLIHHLGDISGILFFLMGAMTVVELVDVHGGFDIITSKITSKNKLKLLWTLSFVTFFMSAALDNLTTSIIMAALLRKLIKEKEDLWLFAGMVILAANAGGAWSPIGDVTTIMLWVGGRITAGNIILKLLLPSLACLLVPLLLISRKVKGNVGNIRKEKVSNEIPVWEKKTVMYMGVGSLLFVPIFKSLTHLPPFMGILFALSVMWIATEIIHRRKEDETKRKYSISGVLVRIDTPSILFFLGILVAVAALQVGGQLTELAQILDEKVGDIWIINTLIGIFSSLVDNVPLVAGSIGMYGLDIYAQDHIFWELLAYCAGTGGSILIIGSAAGVAIMGILKIDFFWYFKKISAYALAGYFSGILVFLLQNFLFQWFLE